MKKLKIILITKTFFKKCSIFILIFWLIEGRHWLVAHEIAKRKRELSIKSSATQSAVTLHLNPEQFLQKIQYLKLVFQKVLHEQFYMN